MQVDSLELPVDWEKVRIHKQANRIGKRWVDQKKLPDSMPDYGRYCKECGRMATHCPDFKICQSGQQMRDRYGIYGPNNVIYLEFIKRISYFMLGCTLTLCIPMFVLNLTGHICRDSQTACNEQDIIYYWSTYNVLGSSPGSLPHHILWFVFSLAMCLFALYLRKYSTRAYRHINNRNITDSDFAIILRRLPDDTSPDQIIDLIERQIPTQYEQRKIKSDKILKQLRQVKVRDIIMIYRFTQLMEVNADNVKQLKKHIKKHQKDFQKGIKTDPFVPQKLPEVTEFGNSAIVRFNNTRDSQIVVQSVLINCAQKITNYFFPFYNPKTQYKIRQQSISLSYAPDPTDIQWQNVGFTQSLRVVRKLISSLFTLGLLLVSAGLSVALSIWIQSALTNSNASPTGITILLVLVTLTLNVIIQQIIQVAIKLIRLDTFTDQNCQQLTITIINQSINLGFFSIFAPIIAKLPSFIKLDSSNSSNFPLVMFTTIIIQSFFGTTLGFLLQYFEVLPRIYRFLDDRGILINTQTQAYKTFKGNQVPIVVSYAHNVKIVWFGFLYGVVSPICVAIATVGLFLYYLFERILFNSKYSIPVYGGPRTNATMLDMIDLTPFLIGLFNLFLYNTSQNQRQFQYDRRVTGIVIANIVIGGFFAIFPWRTFIHKIYNEKHSNIIQEFDRGKMDTTFEKSYPASKPGAEITVKDKDNNILHEGKRKINVQDYLEEIQTDSFLCRNACCPTPSK